MNILQVVPELNAGGVERTTLEISEALVKAGHQAHIVSAGGRMEEELTRLGGRLHRLNIGNKNPLALRRNTKALIDIIKINKIDIIHARSRAPAWPARAAAEVTGRHFVTTYHGIYNARSRLKKRYNAIMSRGDKIIANSNFTRDHIIREHGTDPKKITVIPRGVDMHLFNPQRVSKKDIKNFRQNWLRKDLQNNDTQSQNLIKIILLPGRLTRWKGQLVAIEALADLPANIKLVLMGDAQGRDAYVNEMRRRAKALGVDSRLHIAKHSDDIPAALMAADIVISASTDPEAFGRVLAEAQAMGRPVVASSHGGALETVENNHTGFLVPPGEPAALAKAIQKTLNWPQYDSTYARARINDNFSKAALQEATLALYGNLMAQ